MDTVTFAHPSTPFSAPHARTARRPLRSVGASLAGFVAIAVLSTATDALLRAAGVFPAADQPMNDGLYGLALAYRAVFGIAGTYLAARLAPSRPLQHALTLGGIGFALSTLGAIALWDLGGHWYALANIAITLPTAFIGGTLPVRTRQSSGTGTRTG
jgi:hypothetical protein